MNDSLPRAGAVLTLAAALAVPLAVAPIDGLAADREAGRAKTAVCVACHGRDGVSRQVNSPNIAGQNEFYLAAQLKAYRDGTRQDPQMNIIAKGLSDEDIANLAAWYAGIKVTVECDCD